MSQKNERFGAFGSHTDKDVCNDSDFDATLYLPDTTQGPPPRPPCISVPSVGGPLEYYLQRKQYVPQCTRPCLLLAELQLDRCLPYLVLDDSEYISRAHRARIVDCALTGVGNRHTRPGT